MATSRVQRTRDLLLEHQAGIRQGDRWIDEACRQFSDILKARYPGVLAALREEERGQDALDLLTEIRATDYVAHELMNTIAPDPTLDLLCGQLTLHLQGALEGDVERRYRLLAKRVLDSLPERTAARLRQAPEVERDLLADTLEDLLHDDPRTRRLVGVILTPRDQTTRGSGHRQDDRVRVLILTSQPDRMSAKSPKFPRLRLEDEGREIQLALRSGVFGRQFEVTYLPAVQAEDLSWALLEYEPDLLHFSGHGYRGAILLRRPDGSAWPITGEVLARHLKIFKSTRLRCVILNACETSHEAEMVAREVGAVVARSGSVRDQAALVFSKYFYEGLGYGKTLREAFDSGCCGVDTLGGWGEAAKPQLLGEGGEVRFAGESEALERG